MKLVLWNRECEQLIKQSLVDVRKAMISVWICDDSQVIASLLENMAPDIVLEKSLNDIVKEDDDFECQSLSASADYD
ncbi:hypothetical protein Lal_00016923 [Lupinus albus]|nr:hypothetical protein Lal_00016923 [Lupinus albus]